MGVDFVFTYPFDQGISRLSARDFITDLYDDFHFQELLIGYDFALGRDREGGRELLGDIGIELGYAVREIPPHQVSGEVVSSSRIRESLVAQQSS
jgi:riboflavin kinase/FMN adenylyltransferase